MPLFLSKTLNKFLHLPGSYASFKVIGTRITREISLRLEIPVEITFVLKETATERLKKALHRINMMIEEIVLKCKNEQFFLKNEKIFCNPALSLSFPMKK